MGNKKSREIEFDAAAELTEVQIVSNFLALNSLNILFFFNN